MTPSEIKSMTLKQLRATLLEMTSPAWDVALTGKTEEEITEAARTLLAVQRARLRLENEKLAGIRDSLRTLEGDFVAGKNTIDQALSNLQETKVVLGAVKNFLTTLGKVIAIVV
jgi:uncharacterized protein involved in exopolysaccharide biosynthesis